MGHLIIGFDASPIYGNKTGVEYYALRLYSTLKSELGKSGEIIAFSKEPIAEIPEAVILKSDLPLFLWRQIVLPRELKRRNVTSLHSPVTAIPLFTHCPSIATVHDVSYRIADKGISRNSKLTQILTCALAMRMARFIVAVSETTAGRVKRFHPRQAAKVRTVLSGALANFRESPSSSASLLNIAEPYLLQLGRIDFRKNPLASLEAFRHSGIYKTHSLIFIGSSGNATAAVKKYLADHSELADRVILTGYLPEDTVHSLVKKADALLYPSEDEGFGHPPFEAIAAGTLPIVSDIPVFRELLSNAAVFVDGPDSFANALRHLAGHMLPMETISAAGQTRLRSLQWSAAAGRIIELHKEATGL